MPPGLKQTWGLNDAKTPTSTAQADQFKAAFQASLNSINQALQYTAVNAEASKHGERAAKRDKLLAAYQAVLAKINPGNPSIAQASIDKTLAAAKTLATEVSAFKDKVEAAVKAWQAKEPAYEKGVTQVEELETWEDKQAAALRSAVNGVRELVNKKSFEQAVKSCDDALAKLAPIYDEYLRQKEAKGRYDQDLAALQPRLSDASVCQYAKLTALQEKMLDLQTKMEAAATAKDYVQALQLLSSLAESVDAYIAAKEELEKKQQEYEQALAALQPKLTDASQCQYEELTPMQMDIVAIQSQMEAAAHSQDYDVALQSCTDLATKVDAYLAAKKELEDKKQKEYETARKAAQAKVDDCMVSAREFASLNADRQDISKKQAEMEAAAQAQDFDKAKQLAGELESKADAYLAKAKKEQEKYDKKGEEITKQLDGASDVTRADVAKAAANGLSSDELQHLPITVRNRLLAEMQKDGLSDDEKAASKKLFSKKFMDPEFEKLDNEARKKMIEKMKNDPEFKKARDNWNTLTEAERVAIMQKAVDYQADAYGIPKTTIATYSKDDSSDYGYYRHSDGKLYVNSHDAALKNGGFDEAIDTAVHENGHRHQSTLIDQLNAGKIKPGDPLYNQAMTFKLNDTVHGYYIQPPKKGQPDTPNRGREYFTQPQEHHSRVTGRDVQNAGIGK